MTTANSTSTSQKVDISWKAAASLLSHLKNGSLTVHYKDDTFNFGEKTTKFPSAEVTVHDGQVFREMFTGGELAAAECYIKGMWDSPDLTKVVQIFAANISNEKPRLKVWSTLGKAGLKIAHWLNQNTIKGSKRNIQAHYDLGNDLFTQFLDKSMMYSSAIYPTPDSSLEEAQEYRLDRICQKLQLSESNHLLEIGTGWGSMAIHAAKNFGCKVTTTTISEEQFAYTAEKIKEEGLEDRITLLKSDYRLLTGQYDRLVSIEMIEAVGHKFLPSYFSKIDELLTDDGIALLQSITMPDQRYSSYKNSVDFIRKYIFPGGHLPSISLIHQHIAKQTTMTVNHFEDISQHYAQTLNDWHNRFVESYPKLNQEKYDREFYRMWRYYFAYCEGGFLERAIGTSQIVFSKSGASNDWVVAR
jgi:cyclopropane-fatty-acyl-phospholipid synthase